MKAHATLGLVFLKSDGANDTSEKSSFLWHFLGKGQKSSVLKSDTGLLMIKHSLSLYFSLFLVVSQIMFAVSFLFLYKCSNCSKNVYFLSCETVIQCSLEIKDQLSRFISNSIFSILMRRQMRTILQQYSDVWNLKPWDVTHALVAFIRIRAWKTWKATHDILKPQFPGLKKNSN